MTEQTVAEMESEIEAMKARIKELKAAKSRKTTKPTPTSLEDKFSAEAERVKEEEGTEDPVVLLSTLLKRQVRHLEHMETHNGPQESYTGPNYYANLCTQKGRVHGLAAALAVLKGTTVRREMLAAME